MCASRDGGLWSRESDVHRPRYRSVLHGAGLLLAGSLALVARDTAAQTAMREPDPFAPKLESDPDNPPRFAQADKVAPARTVFQPIAPPASGAGTTGFDATNAPKRYVPKISARAPGAGASPTQSAATPALDSPATTSTTAPPPPPSPYNVPQIASEQADTALVSATPGGPPVDEIRPIRKPVKRKALAEPEDPYAALGIRVGSFDLFPAVELRGGYDTNPGQNNTNAKAAWLYTVAPELRVQSNWSRHELRANVEGNYTGYSPDQTPTLSRPYLNGTVDGRVDVTSLTRIDLGSRVLVSTDNPGSPNLQAGLAKLPIYTTFGGYAGVGQRFNRFELSAKGDAERTVYQESELIGGLTASNEDRNYDQYSGTLRGGYELLPGVVPFVEVTADTRQHDLSTDSFGYQRDSRGLTGKLGTSFKLSHALTGDIAVGYTKRLYEDPRLQDLGGLIGEASLVWTASALTTVKLTGTSVIGESTQPGVSGVLYRDVALQVDHAFRNWLIGSVKLGFGNDDYVGDTRNDERYSVGGALTYKFSRELALKGEVRQNWLASNIAGTSYAETVFLLGLRVQR
jgi:hypothetical protein